MQHLQPNTTLQGGKYRIERVLGQGGFGITYLARNTVFDIDVAIKEFFMKDENDRDGSSVTMPNTTKQELFHGQIEKFKKEAKRMFAIKNEHIVGVQDLFEENGTAYYVMDYVDGENLAERLKRTGKPMTEQEVRAILPQILDALKSVHDAGIWHLDLKPANIMVDKSGNVKLIDFGASKQLDAQKGGATASTAISYTNGYAPREQMEQNYDKFGPWTDIYALGATFYNLLTNQRPPLPTDIDDDISEDKHVALTFPAEVSNEMKQLVLSIMKTNHKQRPQSINELQLFFNTQTSKAREYPKSLPPKNVTGTIAGEETNVATPPIEVTIVEREVSQSPQSEPSPVTNRESPSDEPLNGCGLLAWCVLTLVLILIVLLVVDQCNSSQGTGSIGTQPNEQIQDQKLETVKGMPYKTAIGKCKYTGPVDARNNPHGRGIAQFSDGRYYHGGFVHGVLTGDSVYFSYPNGDTFEGSFENGEKKEGYVKERGKNTNGETWEYEGEYKSGKWNGKGTIKWSDGHKYEGEFKEGARIKGTYTWPEKRKGYMYKYEGEFKKNEFDGKGTVYYVGGETESGIWKNGKYMGSEEESNLTPLERKVVGKHLLSLQWISWDYFGTCEITKSSNGTFRCVGSQYSKENSDYLKLDGYISIISADHLQFTGVIKTKIHHLNSGNEYVRQGSFDFISTAGRKYWREQEMAGPDGVTDYIDIYFKNK